MPALSGRAAIVAAVGSLLLATAAMSAENPPAAKGANILPLDALWEKLAQREAGPAYAAARQMVERGDASVLFLAARVAGGVQLSRRLPYDNPRDLQFHRAAYVLECLGTAAAQKVRAKITYAPVAPAKPYLDKRRLDALGDLIPSGAVFRWGTDRFAVDEMHEGQFAVSNDGKLAATGPGSRSVRVLMQARAVQVGGAPAGGGATSIQIWNTTTGRVTWEVPCGVDGRYLAPMIFTPDGKYLVYQRSGQIVVTVAATGPITQQWPTHLEPLTAMAISADGETLYTGHSDGSLNIFKFPSGEKLGGKRIPGAAITHIQAGTPEFVIVDAVAGAANESRLWDVKKRDWAAKQPKVEEGSFCSISPDAKSYAVAKMGNPIELRSLAKDEVLKKLDWIPRRMIRGRVGRRGGIVGMIEYLDAQHLLLSLWPEPAQVVDLNTGKAVWQSDSPGYNAAPISFSANGRFLIGMQRNQLQIIDLTDGSDLVRARIAKAEDPHLVVSEDGGTALAIRDGRIWQFDPCMLEPLAGLHLSGTPLAISAAGRFCLTTDSVWEPASETVLCHVENIVPAGQYTFHRNGRWLLAGGSLNISPNAGGSLKISPSIDLWSGGPLADTDQSQVREKIFSPDGRFCLKNGNGINQETTCCDAQSGRPLWHGPPSNFAAAAPLWIQGGRLVGYSNDVNCDIRETQSGKIVDQIDTGSERVRILAVAPDGSSYAFARGGQAEVVEWATRKTVFESPFRGQSIQYLPGGRFLVAKDRAGMATVWDLSSVAAPRRIGESATDQLPRLWGDLSGTDPRRAYAASWAYVAAGQEAVAYLDKRLVEGRRVDEAAVKQLIAELDHDDYRHRREAFERLQALGQRVIPHLEKAAKETNSLEVVASTEKLLRLLSSGAEPALLQRAGFISRQIGTPQSEELLVKLGEYSSRSALAPLPAPTGR